MNVFISKEMGELLKKADKALERGEEQYSVKTDQLDYFPREWDSVFTYINENILRLHNLYAKRHDERNYEKIEDKWIDLFNYVRMGYAVMEWNKARANDDKAV